MKLRLLRCPVCHESHVAADLDQPFDIPYRCSNANYLYDLEDIRILMNQFMRPLPVNPYIPVS